jgi:ribonuclease HI
MHCTHSIKAIAANAARANTSTSSQRRRCWTRPLANLVKVNVDAAFSIENQSGASGVIIRNNQGILLAASTTLLPHVSSASMAEATTMLHGLTLANSLGYSDVEAESDSLKVIQICGGMERIWNDATAIYADILNQAGSIGKVVFSHCGRDTNAAARELARNCFTSNISCNWVDEPHSFLFDALLNDVIVL